jgi:hypothetical protein
VRRLWPGLIVVALALVASGCGSDTKAANDYVDAVNRAQGEFATKFDQLSGQITSTSTATQDRQTLDGFRQAIVKAQADLVSAVTKVQAQINQTIADINKKLRE